MADIQAQAEPQAPAVVDPDASLAALPDAASSIPQPSTEPKATPVDFDQVDGNAYEDLLNQLPAMETPAQAEPVAEPTAPETTPEVVEAAPTEEPTTQPEPSETDAEEPLIKGKDFRPRLGKLPEITKEAIALVKQQLEEQGTHLSLAEAESRVNAKYGITPETQAAAAKAEAPTVTPDAIQGEIDALKAELKSAAQTADTMRMAEIQLELEDKRDSLFAAKEKAAESARTVQQSRMSALDQSKVQAQTFYPAVKDPVSALSKAWNEVHAELQQLSDPLLQTPEAPFRITQMAAARLGIPPVNPAATPKASPPTPSITQQHKRPVQPAPGSARSAVPSDQTGQLQAKINGAKSMNDYERLLEEFQSAKA